MAQMVKQPYSETKHVARHNGLKQKEHIQLKKKKKTDGKHSLCLFSSLLLFPLVPPPLFLSRLSLSHADTHTLPPSSSFWFSHAVLWNRCRRHSRNRRRLSSAHPLRKGRKKEMALKINESSGEREPPKGLKIAGQTKARIN